MLLIKAFEILVVKVFVAESCPSNVKSGAVTSPVILNVVALASLSVDPERPDTVPVTLPVRLPTKFCAYTFNHCSFCVPKFLVVVALGTIFPVVVNPATLASLPTNNLLAIPTPPFVIKLPVLIVVASVVPSTSIELETCMLPVTSNAWSGDKLFIPTFEVESILITVSVVPLLFTLISMFDPEVWWLIIPACPSTPTVIKLEAPTVIPPLFFTVIGYKLCDNASLRIKFVAGIVSFPITSASAFSATP